MMMNDCSTSTNYCDCSKNDWTSYAKMMNENSTAKNCGCCYYENLNCESLTNGCSILESCCYLTGSMMNGWSCYGSNSRNCLNDSNSNVNLNCANYCCGSLTSNCSTSFYCLMNVSLNYGSMKNVTSSASCSNYYDLSCCDCSMNAKKMSDSNSNANYYYGSKNVSCCLNYESWMNGSNCCVRNYCDYCSNGSMTNVMTIPNYLMSCEKKPETNLTMNGSNCCAKMTSTNYWNYESLSYVMSLNGCYYENYLKSYGTKNYGYCCERSYYDCSNGSCSMTNDYYCYETNSNAKMNYVSCFENWNYESCCYGCYCCANSNYGLTSYDSNLGSCSMKNVTSLNANSMNGCSNCAKNLNDCCSNENLTGSNCYGWTSYENYFENCLMNYVTNSNDCCSNANYCYASLNEKNCYCCGYCYYDCLNCENCYCVMNFSNCSMNYAMSCYAKNSNGSMNCDYSTPKNCCCYGWNLSDCCCYVKNCYGYSTPKSLMMNDYYLSDCSIVRMNYANWNYGSNYENCLMKNAKMNYGYCYCDCSMNGCSMNDCSTEMTNCVMNCCGLKIPLKLLPELPKSSKLKTLSRPTLS
jgi:hypothetical protein